MQIKRHLRNKLKQRKIKTMKVKCFKVKSLLQPEIADFNEQLDNSRAFTGFNLFFFLLHETSLISDSLKTYLLMKN